VRSKQQQIGKFARYQPWETAAVIYAPKGQAPVAIEAVPAKLGGLEPFAPHGLYGIPEDRLYLPDFDEHPIR
jgi:hypothetical protein